VRTTTGGKGRWTTVPLAPKMNAEQCRVVDVFALVHASFMYDSASSRRAA
jgi:hypothetical protein